MAEHAPGVEHGGLADRDLSLAGKLERASAQLKLANNELNRARDLRARRTSPPPRKFENRAATSQQQQATERSARAAVESAKLNLDFCNIRVPISGRISRERITVGNLIQPGGGPDAGLATIVSIDPIQAYLDADESIILKSIKMSQDGTRKTARDTRRPIFLGPQNEENCPHEGYIDFVDNRLDAGTGTLRVRGVFKSWDPLIIPGFFVRPRVAGTEPKQSLLIPDSAIGTDQGEPFVYVVNDKSCPSAAA